jgi:hypothetical protein
LASRVDPGVELAVCETAAFEHNRGVVGTVLGMAGLQSVDRHLFGSLPSPAVAGPPVVFLSDDEQYSNVVAEIATIFTRRC